MSDKPVIVINIDDTAFTQFQDRYNKYYESLETMPALWKDINAEMAVTNASMAKLADQAKTEKKPLDPRAEKLDKEKSARLVKDEKSWARIEKHVTTTGREMSGLARMTIGIASGGRLGALGGAGITGAFAGLYAAVENAAKSLAALNLQGRALHMAPGKSQAFSTAYGPLGVGDDLLGKIASAKMDSTKWAGLIAAGLSPDEIQSEEPDVLAEKFLAGVHKGDAERGALQGGQWRRGSGIDAYIDDAQANRLSSYSDDDLGKMHDTYLKDIPKFERDQADADKGTALRQHLSENWGEVSKAFDHAAITLAPALTLWSDKATALTVALINATPGAVKYVGDVVDTAKHNIDKSGPVGHIEHDPEKPFFPGFKGIKDWWNDDHRWGTFGKHGAAGGANGSGANSAPGEDPRHNPGNMRPPGDGNHFQTFTSDSEGVRAADRQLQIYNDRDHLDTIDQIVHKWAPKADNNDPDGYAAIVAQRAGFEVGEHLNMKDPGVRARVESAMFQVESNRHRDLTPERVQAMYDLNFTDAPKPKAAPGDDNVSAVKSASGEAQDMTIYAEDDPALSAHAETHRVLKKIATQKIDPQIIQINSDGSDSKMPPILQRPPGQGAFPANQNINVKVSAPAGSSVAVTSSNFPG